MVNMEEKLIINGGKKLVGSVQVDASKNPILCACTLCEGEVLIKNFVELSDTNVMREILEVLNIQTTLSGSELYINATDVKNAKISHELTGKLRASIFTLGALLGRFRSAVIAHPGGCKIGLRPIDIFLKSFRKLGAKIIERHGYLYCNGENLKSGEVILDFPSVGATESLIMCATLLDGETTLKNVAKEPEIVDLQNFLNSMGAKIFGAGTDCIKICGVKKLHGTKFEVMPDRIVAGTYLLAVATCGGDCIVEKALARHNESLISFLKQTACVLDVKSDTIRVKARKRLNCVDKIQTLPYPFFPTDLQPQMMALQSVCKGSCIIQENLFENRFGCAGELVKMGANIEIKDRNAIIKGVETLYGADVFATDLRAGAALVIAGMRAEGYTTIHNVGFIDRGYFQIEKKYGLLGADIVRKN